MEASHQPVMLNEVLSLAEQAFTNINQQNLQGFRIVDGTTGAGGHSLSLAGHYLESRMILCDRDQQMLNRARTNFQQAGLNPDDSRFFWFNGRASEIPASFLNDSQPNLNTEDTQIAEISPDWQSERPFEDTAEGTSQEDSEENSGGLNQFSSDNEISKIQNGAAEIGLDFALLDLGISMLHLKEFERGFSYEDSTLDMRLDTNIDDSAQDLVNNLPEKALANLIYEFGEERASRKIAHRIVQSRPVESARQLAEIIAKAIPGPRNRPHPARKTFQALRIAVNNELEEAEAAARHLASFLRPGGILAIITFHSLEDRIIKRCFAELCGAGDSVSRYDAPMISPEPREVKFEKAIKKSLAPSREEQDINLASRSARLRAIRRIIPR
ncbi:MAG: 16S rRNA (cytosine(1402)-N(4))-methyltransferase RsmH [Leptospiraceae bacterium]